MATNTQFSIAVHLLAGLGFFGGERTSADLAQSVNTSPSFIRRIVAKLSKAELVTTTMGKTGACSLAKGAKDISLLDIYKAVEPPKAFAIHDYPEQKACHVSCTIKTTMEHVLGRAQESMEASLQQITLAEVIEHMRG